MEPVAQFATNSDPTSTAVKLTSVLPAIKSEKSRLYLKQIHCSLLCKFIFTCIDYLKIYLENLWNDISSKHILSGKMIYCVIYLNENKHTRKK